MPPMHNHGWDVSIPNRFDLLIGEGVREDGMQLALQA